MTNAIHHSVCADVRAIGHMYTPLVSSYITHSSYTIVRFAYVSATYYITVFFLVGLSIMLFISLHAITLTVSRFLCSRNNRKSLFYSLHKE